jgi:RNA polymerase sigma-70 factor (ECF subfamily)
MNIQRSLLTVAIATFAAGAALAMPHGKPGDFAKHLDTNGDGQVQIAEIEASAAKQAAEIDANADGNITTIEMKAWHEAQRAKRAEARLLRLDTNQDGKVSVDEFAAARVERASKRDANGDGVIAADEMRGKHRGHRGARRGAPQADCRLHVAHARERDSEGSGRAMIPGPAASISSGVDPDADAIAAAARGDELAFARLVDRHLGRVHALAYRALGVRAEAEDVAQEALLRAWRQLPTWRPGEALFSTWLQRVTLNLVNDRLRRRREQVDVVDLDPASTEPGPEQDATRIERAARVRAALQQLPERQRDALLLCHFEGLGNIEAAAALDVSVEALESLLGRARRRLRELLIDT